MTAKVRIESITKETFKLLPIDNKLDVIFDFITGIKADISRQCNDCDERSDFCGERFKDIEKQMVTKDDIKAFVEKDIKDELRMSLKWRIIYFTLVLFGSAFGGVLAHWLGIETINPLKTK